MTSYRCINTFYLDNRHRIGKVGRANRQTVLKFLTSISETWFWDFSMTPSYQVCHWRWVEDMGQASVVTVSLGKEGPFLDPWWGKRGYCGYIFLRAKSRLKPHSMTSSLDTVSVSACFYSVSLFSLPLSIVINEQQKSTWRLRNVSLEEFCNMW